MTYLDKLQKGRLKGPFQVPIRVGLLLLKQDGVVAGRDVFDGYIGVCRNGLAINLSFFDSAILPFEGAGCPEGDR